MRIGLFSDTFPPEINGVANSTYIVFSEMLRHGHEVYVITTRTGIFKAVWDEDGRVLRLAGIELKFLYGYQMSSFIHPFALEEIRKLHLDLIHAQTEFGIGIFARKCAREFHIPLVMTYHTTYEDYTHYVNFIHSERLDAEMKERVADVTKLYADASMEVIVPSEKTKESLLSYQIYKKINVIPTGLQLDRFSPGLQDPETTEKIRSEFNIAENDRLVIYVGRIAEEKALDLVISGFAKAKEQGTGVKLLIVGGGPDLERLREHARSLGLSDCVGFAGPIENTKVPDYYRSADAFISASLSETQGMTFIEALASGLPLFARRDEVLKDLLIEGKTGWYFDDEETLAEALKKFCEVSEEQMEKISEDCVKQASPYSSEVFYNQLMGVYNRVVEEYEDTYLLTKARAKANTIEITLKRGLEKELVLDVSLDDFYEYGLKKGRNVSASTVEILQKNEVENKAYQRCLNKLAVRDRSVKEIGEWLRFNTKCDEAQINAIVDRLCDNGYLNDAAYAEAEVLRMKSALNGEEKIVHELMNKGIPEEAVRTVLSRYSDEEDNARILAEKVLKSKKNSSGRRTMDVIRTKLVQHGFSVDMANTVISKLDLSGIVSRESDNLAHTIEKAKRKYSRKYSGIELKARVYKSCMQQGYSSSDVVRILDGMEWFEDEED
ncbi:MAG: RecX family transcriptional regulator [Solobacterium sp.]|nr:RecX family transcriptional regulator [Solobacterium sp.]